MKHILITATLFISLISCDSNEKKESKTTPADTVTVNKNVGALGQTLFKDYKFGQSIDEFKSSGEYQDCTDFFETPALCKEGVRFLDNDYSAGLIFNNNQLQKVILYTEFSEEIYQVLPASLQKNNFQLVLLADDAERIDLLVSGKKETQEKFWEMITVFENKMLSGNDGLIAFIETKDLKKEIQSYGSTAELLLDAPPPTREIDMRIITDEDGTRYISLSFILVKHELENLGKKESF
jgi:hypothetical protein